MSFLKNTFFRTTVVPGFLLVATQPIVPMLWQIDRAYDASVVAWARELPAVGLQLEVGCGAICSLAHSLVRLSTVVFEQQSLANNRRGYVFLCLRRLPIGVAGALAWYASSLVCVCCCFEFGTSDCVLLTVVAARNACRRRSLFGDHTARQSTLVQVERRCGLSGLACRCVRAELFQSVSRESASKRARARVTEYIHTLELTIVALACARARSARFRLHMCARCSLRGSTRTLARTS